VRSDIFIGVGLALIRELRRRDFVEGTAHGKLGQLNSQEWRLRRKFPIELPPALLRFGRFIYLVCSNWLC
jgi:hypothetical protein